MEGHGERSRRRLGPPAHPLRGRGGPHRPSLPHPRPRGPRHDGDDRGPLSYGPAAMAARAVRRRSPASWTITPATKATPRRNQATTAAPAARPGGTRPVTTRATPATNATTICTRHTRRRAVSGPGSRPPPPGGGGGGPGPGGLVWRGGPPPPPPARGAPPAPTPPPPDRRPPAQPAPAPRRRRPRTR